MIVTDNGVVFGYDIAHFFGMFRVYSNAVLLLCGSITLLVISCCVGDGDGLECRTLGADAVVLDCSDILGDEAIGVESSVVVFGDSGIDSILFNCVANLSNALRTGSPVERDGVVDDGGLVSIVMISFTACLS